MAFLIKVFLEVCAQFARKQNQTYITFLILKVFFNPFVKV